MSSTRLPQSDTGAIGGLPPENPSLDAAVKTERLQPAPASSSLTIDATSAVATAPVVTQVKSEPPSWADTAPLVCTTAKEEVKAEGKVETGATARVETGAKMEVVAVKTEVKAEPWDRDVAGTASDHQSIQPSSGAEGAT